MENKEHEAFESVFTAENGWDLTCINGCYQNIGTFKAFAGWQAAKEHATPEGFVLVKKELSRKSIRLGLKVLQETDDIEKVFGAMIEAQEQSHDNSK